MNTLIVASFAVLMQFSLLAAIVPLHSQKSVKSFIVASKGMTNASATQTYGSRVPAVVERNK